MQKIVEIDIDQIQVNNSYLRLDTDVSELEKSISTVGVIAPLIINKEKRLLAGGRRYRALSNLGRKEVPVIEVDLDEYKQELISIDENIVRKDLHKIEFEANLSRAKELYTAILKSDPTQHSMAKQELQQQMMGEEQKQNSEELDLDNVEVVASEKFVQDIREKTGLSSSQIYQAIRRDEKSSPAVKDARNRGELSITQTNELVKLESNDQEKLLPLISNKTTAELRKIVKEGRTAGIDAAVAMAKKSEAFAREMNEIKKMVTKLHKFSGQLCAENVLLEGKVADKIKERWSEVKTSMDQLLGE